MPRPHYTYLDLARGLAAPAVFAGHLRAFVFVDFQQAGQLGLFWKIFYFLTGLGHSAVMVFFVLSGFLIGENVARSVHQAVERTAIQRTTWLFGYLAWEVGERVRFQIT